MNPAKLLDDVLLIVQRYAPILVVHFLLLLWLSAGVIDPGALPDGTTLWAALTARINSALKAIGLSLSLWYVLAALVIAYLAAFEWVRSLVTSLPFLRLRFTYRYKPQLLGYAGQVLRLRPDFWKVSEALDDLVEKYNREIRETNRPHPYKWQFDREHTYMSYYGTLLVMLGTAAVWALSGGALARSSGAVWQLVWVTGIACFIVRWRTVTVFAEGRNNVGYWAVREFKRRRTDDRNDPLAWKRAELIEKQARFVAAARKHPAVILQSLIYRLPVRFTRKVLDRLRPPYWGLDSDWDILASHALKYQDEKDLPPDALRVDSLSKPFKGLLECPGAGLCILAPQRLGFAPAVPGSGSIYSFAERRHLGYSLTITLTCHHDLSDYALRVFPHGNERAFLAEIGDHPIELAAQHDFPADGKQWYSLTGPEFDEADWPSEGDWPPDPKQSTKVVGGITLSLQLPVRSGSTYLMRARSRLGTQAVVVFQCFRIETSAKIVLAWRILDVHVSEEEAPPVAAWWQPQAWMALWENLAHHERKKV